MQKLLSVHVAKAGGTSTKKILETAYGNAFMADYADNPADPISQRQIDPVGYYNKNLSFPDEIKCIHGHMHPGKYGIDNETIVATVLRHPIDNIISIYTYGKRHPHPTDALHRYFLTAQLTILQMARLPLLRRLFSVTYFGDFDMGRFNLIGRHEHREEAIKKMSNLVGAPFELDIRENITPSDQEREDLSQNQSIRRQLEDILADDVRFDERFTR